MPWAREKTWRCIVKILRCFSHSPTKTADAFLVLTLVVFDGEIRVVEHLWDQTIVKVVSLDWVVFVYSTDSLNHLCRKQMSGYKEERAKTLDNPAYSFCPYIIMVVRTHLMKYPTETSC